MIELPKAWKRSTGADFFAGVSMPWSSLSLAFSQPRLRALVLLAGMVCGLAFIAALFIGVWASEPVASHFIDATEHHWGHLATRVLVGLVLCVGLALSLPQLAVAPLHDSLTTATETLHGASSLPQSLLTGTWVSLKYTVLRIALSLAGLLVLSPVLLVPVAGTFVWLVASSFWSMWWLTAEYVSNSFAKRSLGFRTVVSSMRERPWLVLGVGASLYLILWVPFVNLLLAPIAVIAGARLFLVLERDRGSPFVRLP